jgi:hypothetical protein
MALHRFKSLVRFCHVKLSSMAAANADKKTAEFYP